MEIYDLNGELIQQENNVITGFQLKNVSAGAYMLKVFTNEILTNNKLIVE